MRATKKMLKFRDSVPGPLTRARGTVKELRGAQLGQQNLNICSQRVTKSYLKQMPTIGVGRLAIALAMSLSWFALTNHCELAAATAWKPIQAHSCCEKDKGADKAPVKDNQHSRIECCKAGHPAIGSIGKKAVSPDTSSAPPADLIASVVFPDAPTSANILELGTGPPFASSFAEVVLQRSILAHAPPYLV